MQGQGSARRPPRPTGPGFVPAPRPRAQPGVGPDALDQVLRHVLGAGARRVAPLADLLAGNVPGGLDGVRANEDEFPRLAYDGTLHECLRSARRSLRPGGVMVAAVPELSRLRGMRTAAPPPKVARCGDDREVTVQVWDWSQDGQSYGLDVLRLVRTGGAWELGDVTSTRHRVLAADEVAARLRDAGFRQVRRLPPTDTGHRVPVWLATAPG